MEGQASTILIGRADGDLPRLQPFRCPLPLPVPILCWALNPFCLYSRPFYCSIDILGLLYR